MSETTTYLRLVFLTETGDTHTISLKDPKSNLTSTEVSQVMQNIISRDIILSSGGALTGIKEAYVEGVTVNQLLP